MPQMCANPEMQQQMGQMPPEMMNMGAQGLNWNQMQMAAQQ